MFPRLNQYMASRRKHTSTSSVVFGFSLFGERSTFLSMAYSSSLNSIPPAGFNSYIARGRMVGGIRQVIQTTTYYELDSLSAF